MTAQEFAEKMGTSGAVATVKGSRCYLRFAVGGGQIGYVDFSGKTPDKQILWSSVPKGFREAFKAALSAETSVG